MSVHDITVLLGGLALFLHGLNMAREGMQLIAGDKLRSIIASITEHRLLGMAAGAAVTVVLQSSTATTVMLVGFAAAGLLTLAQAMAILLGADIGTTFTVQLISFRFANWALLIVFVGFAVRFITKRRRLKYVGSAILGFGLLFFGISLIGQATVPLKDDQGFAAAMAYLQDRPLLGVITAGAVTVLFQGSAATIGLLISLAHAGTIGIDAALPMILGANIGSTVTPLLSAIGAPADGKRVSVAHLLFKCVGVALLFPFMRPFAELVVQTSADSARQIANAHTLFNAGMSFLFLPFTPLAARMLTRYYTPPEKEERYRPKYLDPRAIETPPLAFAHATREFLRMSDVVNLMLKDSMRAFEKGDLDLLADIEGRDDKADVLNREIRFYLARIGQEHMTPEQAARQLELITLTADMEGVGDIINKGIVALARKKVTHGLAFSDEGWRELSEVYQQVIQNFDTALASFATNDEALARKVLRDSEHLRQREAELRQTHIQRLHAGLRESLETSSIHLDLLGLLVRIDEIVSSMANVVCREREAERQADA